VVDRRSFGRGVAGEMGINKSKTTVFVVLSFCLAMLAAATGPALAAPSPTKPITGSVSPASVPVGATTAFTLTLTNGSSNQSLGSMNITTPAVPEAGSVSAQQGTLTWTAGTTLIKLRTVGLAPGASMTVSATISVPCSAGSSLTWVVQAKQSNDFNGPPGNNFSPYPLNLTNAVTGSCHLEFTAQPADTTIGDVTTSVAGTPSGAPVAVSVLDGNDAVITAGTYAISLAVGTNPGGATSPPAGGSANTTSGVATFPSLTIDEVGVGYTLVASTTGATSATSDPFNVVNKLCTANTVCQDDEVNGKTKAHVDAPVGGDGGYITFSSTDTNESGFGCEGKPFIDGVSVIFTLDVVGGNDVKTVTVTYDKSLVRLDPNNGASFYQICYLGDETGATPHLLPDCVNQDPIAPCILSKNKTKAGDVVVKFLAPAGDPKWL
jgi:hypothetical protein